MERQYERGEGRYKHRRNKDEAGFEPGAKGAIGKCPKTITQDIATEILAVGIEYFDQPDDEQPCKKEMALCDNGPTSIH